MPHTVLPQAPADPEAARRAEEERLRELAAAATLRQTHVPQTTGAAAARTYTLDEAARRRMLESFDPFFEAQAALGHPAVDARQRTIIAAIFTQEFHAAQSWDGNYTVAWAVTSVYQYGGATIRTGAQALTDAARAFTDAGGRAEDWTAALSQGTSAAWTALRARIGNDGARAFEQAHGAVGQRTLLEIAESAGHAMANRQSFIHTRSSHPLRPETLALILAQDPTLHATLTRNGSHQPTYGELVSHLSPETQRYTNALTLSDSGTGNQIPISRTLIHSSPMGTLYGAGGVPVNDAALERINNPAPAPSRHGMHVREPAGNFPSPHFSGLTPGLNLSFRV